MTTLDEAVDRVRVHAEASFACANCAGAERWYHRTRATIIRMADRYGVAHDRAIVASAILSTNATVAAQLQNTERVLRDGADAALHFGSVVERVRLALDGDLDGALSYKRGRKIIRFAENLMFPWRKRGGTMDRHQCRIVVGGCPDCAKNLLARKGGYDLAENAHEIVAAEYGVTVNALQARTWVHLVDCEEGKNERCDAHQKG